MGEIINWKMFLTQFEPKCKAEYLVYGDGFPSMSFLLPELAQNKWDLKIPVRFAIPKSSKALGDILEALPSVIDVDFATVGGGEYSGLTLEKGLATNDESENLVVGIDSIEDAINYEVAPPRRELDGTTRIKVKPKKEIAPLKHKFRSHILYSWKFSGRYNKASITFTIEKWKEANIEEIAKVLYNGAPHSAYIPIARMPNGFMVPEIFKERHESSMKTELTILRPAQFSPSILSGFEKWIDQKS